MKILYFTATGNNLHIAKSLNGELLSIPQLIKENKYTIEDDTIGIITPVFFWSIPDIVKNYLKKANIKANYIFRIVSYGTMYYGAINHIETILNNKNLKLNYTNDVKMVDNYLPFFNMNEEKKKKDKTKIESKIEKIKKDIENKKEYQVKTKKYANLLSNLSIHLHKPLVEKLFKIKIKQEECTNCKICQKVCPKGNIQLKNNKPKIGKECELCMACAQNCPQKVLGVNIEKDTSRYRNPNIKLTEIIKSNNTE